MEIKFFGTHNHTTYSNINGFNDSTVKVKDLLLTAHALGHQGVAMTDHANISAHIQAIQTTKALKKEGKLPEDFTLALGVEAYVVDEEEMSVDVSNNERTNFYHLILIAKDEIGHHQIRQLTSKAYKRSFHYRGILRVPMFYTDFKEIIGDNKGHLIATSACLGGYLGKLVLEMLRQPAEARSHHKDHIYNFMCWAMDTFGEDNFYLELQPSFNRDQIDYNEMLVKIAKAYRLPLTIATDVHYLRPENQRTHSIFLKSDEKNSGGRELGDFYNDTYLHTVEEMREKMRYLEEDEFNRAIQNTATIATQIKDYDLAHDQIIPKIPLPPRMEWFYDEELYQMAKNYKHLYEMATNNEPYDNYLISLIFKGMREQQVPVDKWQSKFERLDIECQQLLGISRVKGQRLSSYFITMNKCMDLIWEEVECLIGVGRGSAMGYLMNRYLNIVQVDCTEQEVEHPWWRFIHESKVEIPK